ncbi:Stem-specific protein TSJT1 [Apostasia shenzhenica]|uniref:Stem-specific protein TSJT1 n=1 Tax=Apostasia shenzhenica TaxID=1088818 RepID=A0A2I0B570_9ASPA|nr:Stem-specific protein TSJT1 [Apostasia shenzhenica]
MLGVFSREVAEPPEELVTAGSRTPSPKTRASELVNRFVSGAAAAAGVVSLQLGSSGHLAYSHAGGSPFRPRLFAVKDDIFCLFEGIFDNLGSLIQYYGLSKYSNEVLLLIEAYKALRDRAPYTANSMLGHLSGNFAFVLFDRATSTVLVASDPDGKVPMFWGITADGSLAFADDVKILKGSCGKSLAPFPQGCFYSNTLGGLKSYEHPKNKVTATLADEEEICGATFKVEGTSAYVTATF